MTIRQPRDGWIDAHGVRLHYYDWPGAGRPLLCIAGITGNGRYWDALAERLGARHRLIALDARGRGQSDKPPAGSYGLAVHAADTAAVARALGIGPAVVIGHSMGAYVAAILAADYPEVVSHAVLVDGGGSGAVDEATVRAQIKGALGRLGRVFPSFPAYLDYWKQAGVMNPWSEYFERYLRADVEERPDGSVVCLPSPAAVEEDILSVLHSYQMQEYLPRIKAPALVLWAPGGLPEKPLAPKELMEEVAALLPQGRLVPVEGANHYTIIIAPRCLDQVESELRRFVGVR